MIFLSPWAAALGGAAIPIIAFYLIRTRLERRPVSTFLFWQQLAPQVYNNSLWRKLRRWLSLLLQLLFLLLLVVALSQPLASWQSLKPTALILVLDASVSMAATDVEPNRWSQAMKAAEHRIAQLRFFDEALLIEAGKTPRVLSGWSRNKRTLARALKSAKLGVAASDIRPALALAHHLGEAQGNPEIMLISDGVWQDAPIPESFAAVQPYWIGNGPVNVGLSLFNARRSPAVPGDYQVIARVVGTESSAGQPLELELRRNGGLFDVQPIVLEAGKPWQKTWEGSSEGAVQFEAHLRAVGAVPRDDLAEDNQAVARLDALHPVDVVVVVPPDLPHAFLTAALESQPLVKIHHSAPEALPLGEAALNDRRFYIFYRTQPPPGFKAAAMLLIAPAEEGFWGKPNGFIDSALVSDVRQDEPIMRFVSLENLRLQKAHDFVPPPGTTLFAESFGKPLIFGRWDGAAVEQGNPLWLALAFGLDDSDLVFRTAFPILMGNLVQSLQPSEPEQNDTLPGATLSLLKAQSIAPLKAAAQAEAPSVPSRAWWTAFPVWWWALLLATGWLLLEWWLYSRRMTE